MRQHAEAEDRKHPVENPHDPAGTEEAGLLDRMHLAARSWTPKMIKDLLGPPDALIPHRTQPMQPAVAAYEAARVRAIENTEAWNVAKAAARERSKKARAAYHNTPFARDKDAPAVPELAALEDALHIARVTIERVPISELMRKTRSSREDVLLDYVIRTKTRCSNTVMDRSYGGARRNAFILRAIAQMYPELAHECSRRLRT